MSDMSTLTDACRCGANFSYKGWPPNAHSRHDAWLEAHKICRLRDDPPLETGDVPADDAA